MTTKQSSMYRIKPGSKSITLPGCDFYNQMMEKAKHSLLKDFPTLEFRPPWLVIGTIQDIHTMSKVGGIAMWIVGGLRVFHTFSYGDNEFNRDDESVTNELHRSLEKYFDYKIRQDKALLFLASYEWGEIPIFA